MIKKDGHYYCEQCDSKLRYNKEYDAYFCGKCNEWAEEACGIPECEFCGNRPKRPLLTVKWENWKGEKFSGVLVEIDSNVGIVRLEDGSTRGVELDCLAIKEI